MGMVIVEVEEAVSGVNSGRPVVTNGDGDALFANYFGGGRGFSSAAYFLCCL